LGAHGCMFNRDFQARRSECLSGHVSMNPCTNASRWEVSNGTQARKRDRLQQALVQDCEPRAHCADILKILVERAIRKDGAGKVAGVDSQMSVNVNPLYLPNLSRHWTARRSVA
jgi:hypothetical protein